jgi:putative transcriptional regulator
MNSIETGKFVPSTLLALKLAYVFGTPVEEIFKLEETDFE